MTACRLVLWLLLASWHSRRIYATGKDGPTELLSSTANYNVEEQEDFRSDVSNIELFTSSMEMHSSIKAQNSQSVSSYYLELESGQLFIPRSKLLKLLQALERLRVENSELDFSDGNFHSVLKALAANSDESHSGHAPLSDSIAIPPQSELKGSCSVRCFEIIRDLIHYGTRFPDEDITTETFRDSDQSVDESSELKDGISEANTVLSVQKREAPSQPPPLLPVENNRKNGPTIDEIISGIVQLLGGNVQVSKPALGQRIRPTLPYRKPSSKRVNHRGPAKFSSTVSSVPSIPVTTATQPLPTNPTTEFTTVVTSIANSVIFGSFSSSVLEQSIFPTATVSSFLVTNNHAIHNENSGSETITQAPPTQSITKMYPSSGYTLIEVSGFTVSKSSSHVTTTSKFNSHNIPSLSSITPILKTIHPTQTLISTNTPTSTVISISTLTNIPITDPVKTSDDQIVYGKPYNIAPPLNITTDTIKQPVISPSKLIPPTVVEMTITGSISHSKKDHQSNISSNSSPTGRPYVIPVEIEEVRPYIGPFPPGQFSPGNQPGRKPPTIPDFPRHTSNNRQPPSNGQRYPNTRPGSHATPSNGPMRNQPALVRPPARTKPNTPLVRIDTCIVGDDSTCDTQLNERCVTEAGISSCHCRPGFARSFARGPCIPVISVSMSLKIDRFGDRRLSGSPQFLDTNSDDHHLLENEMKQAMSTLFSYTSYSRTFMGSSLNRLYGVSSGVVVNATVHLEDNEANRHPAVLQRLLQQEVLNAITSRNLNIGDSSLYVDSPPSPGPLVEDVNECELSNSNDCSTNGVCQNTFGSFRCTCKPGYMDKFADDQWKSGRSCAACSPTYCNSHGDCFVKEGRRECKCKGNYIGSRCEIDGEVLGVALGASLAALLIIILTLVCLCVWNRRWKRGQPKSGLSLAGTYPRKASEGGMGHFSRPSIEDRLRWAQITDAMGNVYVPAEGLPPSAGLSPPLPALPPPPSCPSAKHIYATPSRMLLQKISMEEDRGRLYGQLRPKSRGPCMAGHQPSSGYYDMNEYPMRENYGNLYTNPAAKPFYGFEK